MAALSCEDTTPQSLAGVPQTRQPISAVSGPELTILRGGDIVVSVTIDSTLKTAKYHKAIQQRINGAR